MRTSPLLGSTPHIIKQPLILQYALIFGSYFLIELFAALMLKPETPLGLAFGAAWSLLFTAVLFLLPRFLGRLFYGCTYYIFALWTIAQTGYDQMFGRLMWLSDISYAAEGADYADVLLSFSPLWWIGTVLLIVLGICGICSIPVRSPGSAKKGSKILLAVLLCLALLPQAVYARDNKVWGTHSEYAQSSSSKAAYQVMYDSRSTYDLCGIYQLTVKDLWKNEICPRTPMYLAEQKRGIREINNFFTEKGHEDNEMTGVLAGKNIVLVLMESMDDWLITQEDTPTIQKMMDEGICFTDFYSPGYGSVRTFDTEFCTNTGIFLPTTGSYVFDYIGNNFSQSLPNRLASLGYTSQCFHYNSPDFYSRGLFEPAMGYESYISYEEYAQSDQDLFSETFLFDNPQMKDIFFRDGPTLNFFITRSAHLSYQYDEVLSAYALRKYPEYKGKFGHEEVDCARVKAKLVDDFFSRLLLELKNAGTLENTVIVGITDHYTYGFQDKETLMALSGVDHSLLLEKTPCFIWTPNGPDIEVNKTLSTADLLPTLLNLLGISNTDGYLGCDAFDPSYEGYAIFPDGSWICRGVAYWNDNSEIIQNKNNIPITEDFLTQMKNRTGSFIRINNMLLTTDYYHNSSQPS